MTCLKTLIPIYIGYVITNALSYVHCCSAFALLYVKFCVTVCTFALLYVKLYCINVSLFIYSCIIVYVMEFLNVKHNNSVVIILTCL